MTRKKTPTDKAHAEMVELEPKIVHCEGGFDVALWDWNDGTYQIGVTADRGTTPVAVATMDPTQRSLLARLLVEALPPGEGDRKLDARELSAYLAQIRELEELLAEAQALNLEYAAAEDRWAEERDRLRGELAQATAEALILSEEAPIDLYPVTVHAYSEMDQILDVLQGLAARDITVVRSTS